jgi:hypothetical protein
MLAGFNGTMPSDGKWTLFASDLSSGAQAEVIGWGLTITTIPEPSAAALALAVCPLLLRRRRRV